MNLPIIAIRPEPGCSATIAAGTAAGLEIKGYPLFEIRPLAWAAPQADSVDALLIGSANAIRQAGAALESLMGKPVYAVGEATAQAARDAGLKIAARGSGGLQSVLDDLVLDEAGPRPLRLLRLAGAEHVELHPPEGITLETHILYESLPLPLPGELAAKLSGGAVVLLHSAAAARHFCAECDRLSVNRATITLAALGPRIAQAAGGGWNDLQVCTQPAEAALLALAGSLCHGPL